MSLINEVLNELEKRGAHAPAAADMSVRAVPQQRPSSRLPNVLAGLLLLVAAAAAGYFLLPRGAVAPAAVEPLAETATPANMAAPQSAPVSAPAAAQTVAPPVVSQPALPASRLSFELSMVPLPEPVEEETAAAAPSPRQPVARDALRPRLDPPPPVSAALPQKKISPRQHADNEFAKANLAAQQGRQGEAMAGYENVLRLDPLYHEARRAWVGLLLQAKRNVDAEQLLQEALRRDSHEVSFAMLLARLQVERGAVPQALATLEGTLGHAARQPEYQAFYAALLQREQRHKEAVQHYRIALQLAPDVGIWLMGLGISLQAAGESEAARDAYQRALQSNTLSPQLQEFVRQKLKEL